MLPPLNLLFLDSNFQKSLEAGQNCEILRQVYKYDQILIPFFFNEEDDKRALIVAISPETCTVDLFDRERETDSKFYILR